MEKEFANLIEILQKFNGFELIHANSKLNTIHFKITVESTFATINKIVTDKKFDCNFLIMANKEKMDELSYQLILNDKNAILNISKELTKALDTINLGIPDLSLVTIRQMASELKKRENLTFAIVWIEDTERDNIAIEGSGNPTKLIGLLSRGTHMAIEWADKTIKFTDNEEN